ncbi:RidA family protein [Streptomyces sp. NPDC059785]|uniref:RidA family protein n=1 Tax=unclassified Streptomyces TaxID=2593676 RepID=UPI003661335A
MRRAHTCSAAYALAGWRTTADDGRVDETHLTHITAPEGVAPGSGYTHVVTGTGRLVALSGQVAVDERGGLVGPGDPAAQARQVFENLRRCLTAAGATFDDVVKLTYYVTDVAHLPAVRLARDAYVDTRRPPASTAVQVAALFRPELLLEVEAFAVIRADVGVPEDATGVTADAGVTAGSPGRPAHKRRPTA